jgi:hypothetical protein
MRTARLPTYVAIACVAGLVACAAPPMGIERRSPLVEPPGEFSSAVTQETIRKTICVPGWTSTVQPSTLFSTGVKQELLSRAGVPSTEAANYELDHFIPLALGGHPRSQENLWLQPLQGTWNAKTKDRLARKLQVLVCSRKLTLSEARAAIQGDWPAAFRKYVGSESQ